MKAIVIGCGRVGSAVALQLDREGWDVTAIDEKQEALSRLGDSWAGGFVVGHGMDIAVLREAGIEEADGVVVATDGDNTNIVIGQVAQRRFDIQCVVVRVLDPARADWYAQPRPAHRLPDTDGDRRAHRRRALVRDRPGRGGDLDVRRWSRAAARSARTSRARCCAWGTR